MNINFSEEESRTLIEMLTMTGYVMTQASDNAIAKAEAMHELIQKIYQQAASEGMQDCFDSDDETKMIFPNAEVMSSAEDSPLYMLKTYNEYAAADVLSQQLALRDASQQHSTPDNGSNDEFNPEFIDAFIKSQTEYLDEFSRNGFDNVQISKIQLIH